MRFRLLRRRLTISAPRMAVRSALPWPLRWVLLALVLGFCAAIGLWAFEFGKHIAGLDRDHQLELDNLRTEVQKLRAERIQITEQAGTTTASLLTAEKAAQEKLLQQIRQLEADNRTLRDDLGFFEQLVPLATGQSLNVRSLQAEVLGDTQLKWQVLVIQAARKAPQFDGTLEITIAGTLNNKPWSMPLPGGAQKLQFRQYQRMEGLVDLPPQAVVKTVSVKVLEGAATRALHSVKL